MEQESDSKKCVICGERARLSVAQNLLKPVLYCEACCARLESFSSTVRLLAALEPQKKRMDSCPNCGWELSQFNKTKLAGCSFCYYVFEEEIPNIFPIKKKRDE